MNRILNNQKAIKLSKKLKREGKKIVLAGGVFDILHIGHIRFLEAAKKKGDILFILLESDENVKKYKGPQRPINTQEERAAVLSSLKFVDYVINLPAMKNNIDYDRLITAIRPDIIATTKKDPQVIHNIRQAKLIGAEVCLVVNRISNRSTTRIAEILAKENNL